MNQPCTMRIFCTVSLVFAVFLLASLPSLHHISYWPPDADKIAMDGVFMFDFFRDLPRSLDHPYPYGVSYYMRYPSLSIGQRPLFFPAVEAVFYGFMGITYLAPRLAVLCFLFMGMIFWVRLVSRTHDFKTAVLSLMLWVSNPNIYSLSQNILLEIPTIGMCIITLYLLHVYVRDAKWNTALFLGIGTGLTLWTSQKSVFMLPLFVLYPISRKKAGLFLSRKTWGLAGIILLFLVPLGVMSYQFGAHNLAVSLKDYSGPEQTEIITQGHSQLWVYISFLFHNYFSLPILLLSFLGMGLCIVNKDSESLLYALYILCVYMTFTMTSVKIPRYGVYWIPGFCLFAAAGIVQLSHFLSGFLKEKGRPVFHVLCLLPVLFQVISSFPIHILHVCGYEEAARYVIKKSRSPVLFFTGTGNGQFSFFVRKHDPGMTHMVLRGQKIISTSLVSDLKSIQVHLHTEAQIYHELQRLGVQYGVVEEPLQTPNIPAYKALRSLLNDKEKFVLRKTIPLEICTHTRNEPTSLNIYENRHPAPFDRNQVLDLHVPAASHTYKLTLGDIMGDETGVPNRR